MTGAWRGKSLVRGDGPNWVFGVRRVRGEVTKGLAVVQPRLLDLLGGVGVIRDSEVIRLGNAFVAFFPEFFPRLGVDEFLQLCLELLLWWFLVAFRELNRFPRVTETVLVWSGLKK